MNDIGYCVVKNTVTPLNSDVETFAPCFKKIVY